MGEAWLGQFPLRTRGRHIVDANGERFRFVGVSWHGASDVHQVVGGLAVRSLRNICLSVAQMGFTVARLPFSSEMIHTQKVPEGAIDYKLNPQLQGLSPLQVLDQVVAMLGTVGVAVVLSNQATKVERSGGVDENGLWYVEGCGRYTEKHWVLDWLTMATQYQDVKHVIGYDLRSKVRNISWIDSQRPSWGDAGARDWACAARTCAQQLVAGPRWQGLIIIDSVCWPQESLSSLLEPVPPWEEWHIPRDRIVVSLHMYSWSGPGRLSPTAFTAPIAKAFSYAKAYVTSQAPYGELEEQRFFAQMDQEWGFCLKQGVCPVWCSEFGADLRSTYDMRWFHQMCKYLKRQDADFAYWCLNVGLKPGDEGYESYGLLTDDWQPRWGDPRLQAVRWIAGAEDQQQANASALSEVPWCAPLPGPLVPWSAVNESGFMANQAKSHATSSSSSLLPSPRYLWTAFHGRDADAGQDARLVNNSNLAVAKQTCIRDGFGGFALYNGNCYMRKASADTLAKKMVDGFPQTVLFLAREVRVCAVRGPRGREYALVDIGLEAFEGQDAFPACDAWVVNHANLAACRQLCLEKHFGGFAVYGGNAYFRTAAAHVLRRHLKEGFAQTTFYVLTVRESDGTDVPGDTPLESRARVLERLLPKLWRCAASEDTSG